MAPVHYPLLALSSPRRNLYIPIKRAEIRPESESAHLCIAVCKRCLRHISAAVLLMLGQYHAVLHAALL